MLWTAPLLLALWLFQAPYTPPEIVTALPPAHPVQSVEGGEVAFEAKVNRQGNIEYLRLLRGRPPFAQSAIQAVSQWRFIPASREAPTDAKVGIFVVFRRRAIFTAGPTKHQYDWPLSEDEHAALPMNISYPPYPITSVAEGVVILQLRIDREGTIEGTKVIRDIPPLTNAAQEAVREWKFSPAQSEGKPLPGIAIVAISFQRPFVRVPAPVPRNRK